MKHQGKCQGTLNHWEGPGQLRTHDTYRCTKCGSKWSKRKRTPAKKN